MVDAVTGTAKLYPAADATVFIDNRQQEDHWTARWHVLCTRSRHERTVHEQLAQRALEAFVPTFTSVRQWHDRKKVLELPVFPGYVFVRTAYADRLRVLQVPGVARFVTFGDRPAILADEEMDRLRAALTLRKCEPHPTIAAGTGVRIVAGPLQGLSGIVVRERRARLVVSVDCLCRSVAVELDDSDLRVEEAVPCS